MVSLGELSLAIEGKSEFMLKRFEGASDGCDFLRNQT